MSPIGNLNFEILIVDDDPMACASLSMLFTQEGYRVITFADGAGFLAAARMRPPACILLDVHMPAKSGLELLKNIDARTYPTPIIMMASRGDISMAVAAIKAGAYDFVEKQKADMILIRVRDAIDARSARQHQGSYDNGSLSQAFPGYDRLTGREREVRDQVTAAASSKEAGRRLGISPRTVENHRVQIMQKLGAKNTADLLRIVFTRGRVAD